MVIKKTMFPWLQGVTNPNHDATAKYHSQFKKYKYKVMLLIMGNLK